MAAAKPITCYSVITTLLYSLTQILNTEAIPTTKRHCKKERRSNPHHEASLRGGTMKQSPPRSVIASIDHFTNGKKWNDVLRSDVSLWQKKRMTNYTTRR